MFFSHEFFLRLLESDESSSNTETLLTIPSTATDEATTKKSKKKKKPEEKVLKSDESSKSQKTKKKSKKPKGKQAKKQAEGGQKVGKNRQLPASVGTSPLAAETTTTLNMGDDTTEPTSANMNPRPTTSLPPTITTTSKPLNILN